MGVSWAQRQSAEWCQLTMEQPTQPDLGDAQAMPRCVFHPEVETGLSCSRCDRPICVHCMVQAPVGIRCRECASVQKLPTFDVQPSFYMRGILAGATAAILAGLIWGFILQMAPQAYLAGLLSLLVGYVVGESISLATNRKRGTGLAVLAVCCVTLSVCAAWMVYDGIFDVLLRRGSFVPLLLLGLSGYIAVYRVR